MRDAPPWGYRLLLRLLPEAFRERNGRAMEATFAARLRAARGAIGRVRLWAHEIFDLFRTGVGLRWTGRTWTRGETMGEGTRGWLDDLRSAARSLRRAPTTTAISVLTLGLGIGAGTALFSAAERVMLRPVDLPEADRLVAVWRKMGASMRMSPDLEVRDQLRESDSTFDHVLGFGSGTMILTEGSEPLPLDVVWTEPAFFAVAGAEPDAGRLLAADDPPTSVMISRSLWERLGSDPELVGGTLRLDGEPHTVVGVTPRGLTHPSPLFQPPDIWRVIDSDSEAAGARVSSVLGRLAPGVTLAEAEAVVAGINVGRAEAGAQGEIEVMTLGALETRALRDPVLALTAAVILLLALSWASVAGLMLARGEARSREAAVRAALGASARRLTRQQLLEGLIVTASATLLGILVARLAILTLRELRPDGLRLLDGMALNGRVLAFAAGAALVATLLFGALPALRTGRGWVAGLLRGSRDGAPSGARARRVLVVVEVALSFALLVGAVQVVATLAEAGRRDPGFEHEGLLQVTFRLPEWRFPEAGDREAANLAILERVRALPGVESAARGAVPPEVGIFFGQAEIEGGPAPDVADGNEVYFGSSISEGWIETLGLPLVQGRTVTEADARSEESLWLLGEGLAERVLPGEDVVGRRFRVGEEWGRVVGVVGEVLANASLGGPAYEQLWLVSGPGGTGSLAVRVRGEPATVAPALRAAIRSVDPQIPVTEIRTVDDLVRSALARERLTAVLLTGFAATAALLAVVGLYGVLAQVVRVRLREYGIRLSLGAAPGRLFLAIVRGGATTVAIGVVLGGVAAVTGLRLLGSGLPGLGAADPTALAAAAVLLTTVSLLATVLPARRAARADPVEVLRSE